MREERRRRTSEGSNKNQSANRSYRYREDDGEGERAYNSGLLRADLRKKRSPSNPASKISGSYNPPNKALPHSDTQRNRENSHPVSSRNSTGVKQRDYETHAGGKRTWQYGQTRRSEDEEDRKNLRGNNRPSEYYGHYDTHTVSHSKVHRVDDRKTHARDSYGEDLPNSQMVRDSSLKSSSDTPVASYRDNSSQSRNRELPRVKYTHTHESYSSKCVSNHSARDSKDNRMSSSGSARQTIHNEGCTRRKFEDFSRSGRGDSQESHRSYSKRSRGIKSEQYSECSSRYIESGKSKSRDSTHTATPAHATKLKGEKGDFSEERASSKRRYPDSRDDAFFGGNRSSSRRESADTCEDAANRTPNKFADTPFRVKSEVNTALQSLDVKQDLTEESQPFHRPVKRSLEGEAPLKKPKFEDFEDKKPFFSASERLSDLKQEAPSAAKRERESSPRLSDSLKREKPSRTRGGDEFDSPNPQEICTHRHNREEIFTKQAENEDERRVNRRVRHSSRSLSRGNGNFRRGGNLPVDSNRQVEEEEGKSPEKPKVEGPNFEPSGLLAAETNMKGGIVLKHGAPIDARPPDKRWRLYMFKEGQGSEAEASGKEQNKIFHIHRQSTYVFGKEVRVADIPLLHPTVSKQHAVIQFRLRRGEILPYVMDLESTNGTFLNNTRIEACHYYELREQDILRFGRSTREFVLLHCGSVDLPEISYTKYIEEQTQAKNSKQVDK